MEDRYELMYLDVEQEAITLLERKSPEILRLYCGYITI